MHPGYALRRRPGPSLGRCERTVHQPRRSRHLARAPRRPAAGLARPRGCPRRHGRAGESTAAGLRRRMRPAQGPAGRRRQGRGVRPARGRLRGDLRRVDGRRRTRQARDPAADGARAHLRGERPGGQDRPARGAVRETQVAADRVTRRGRAPCLPRRGRQRLRVHARGTAPRPGAAAPAPTTARRSP